jgi:GNAT superfamily N-acetyltransferase
MLVKLYDLPEISPLITRLKAQDIEVRPASPDEKRIVVDWVRAHFYDAWAAECEAAIEQRPVTCFIAVEKDRTQAPDGDPYHLPPEKLVGFACFDAKMRGMFGPTGVQADYRGRDIGKALLLASLHAMASERYAYAVIGWAGPTEFYAKAVGATLIEGSEPGIYRGPLTFEPA